MKFANLLKKELKELLNFQTIFGMLFSLILLYAMGSFMGGVMDKAMSSTEINICDQDNTQFTKSIIESISKDNKVKAIELTTDDRSQLMKANKIDNLVIIPKGFTQSVLTDKKPSELEVVSVMKSTSMSGTLDSAKSSETTDAIKDAISTKLLSDNYKLNENDITTIKDPIKVKDVTVVGEKSANISSALLSSFAMSQGIVVPVIIFMLVMFASQMIISAISTEKIDKTLETLLSAPVSRISVLSAKMLAATIVALMNAVVYMFGFSKYMSSMTGGISKTAGDNLSSKSGDTFSALYNLGLQMMPTDYLLLGLQMFMTIMIALCISLILGAMANDAKAAQTLVMPIMLCLMIPFFCSMFADINTLPTGIKVIMYAIPFTHTFIAVNNLLFNNMTLFWGGFAYQVVIFAIVMFLAVKLFTSDKIFTISLNFGQKAKARKSKALFGKKN